MFPIIELFQYQELSPGVYPRFKKWGGANHGEREERSAEGAEGVGVRRGAPLPTEGGV